MVLKTFQAWKEDIDLVCVPALLLAFARLSGAANLRCTRFRISCLRRCNVHEVQAMMTADERRAATVPVGQQHSVTLQNSKIDPSVPPAPLERWVQLQAEADAISCPSNGATKGSE